MALTQLYSGTATISTSEYSLVNNSTTLANATDDGVFQLFLDTNALTSSEEYTLRIYEKVLSSSTKRIVWVSTLLGVQAEPVIVTPALTLMHGWDFTFIRIAGTDRAFDWSIRQLT
jgi:hypothetical protein